MFVSLQYRLWEALAVDQAIEPLCELKKHQWIFSHRQQKISCLHLFVEAETFSEEHEVLTVPCLLQVESM